MKVSVGTNTSTKFEIEDYKYKKKLSLKPLFSPLYRKNLLFEKVMMLSQNIYNLNNKDRLIDFSNKSYFIFPLKKKIILDIDNKKSNSIKNIYAYKLKRKNINNTSFKKSLSTNESINDTNNKKINAINNSRNLSSSKINRFKNNKFNELDTRKTTRKEISSPFSTDKKSNLLDIKKKLIFNSEKKINNENIKSKIKSVNLFNKKFKNIITDKKRKHFLFKRNYNK